MDCLDLILIGGGEVCISAQSNADKFPQDISDRNGGTVRENGLTDCILADLANVRASHIFGQRCESIDLILGWRVISEKQVEQTSPGIEVGHAKLQFVSEATPHRRVEEVVVVRRADNDGLVVQCVNILKQTNNNALQFTQLMLVVTELCHGIEFIKKQDARPATSMIEQHPQVLRRAAQERRDE